MGNQKEMICTIFGGADIRDYSYVKIKEGFIIAADRGLVHCLNLKAEDKIGLLIGDFDSFEGKIPENIEALKYPVKKDDTDLMLAINEGVKRGYKAFELYGCAGGRAGHMKANTQILSYMCENGLTGVIFGDDYDERVLSKGVYSFENDEKIKYVSIFSETEKSEISVKGLKYSGDFTLSNIFPLGVSNEFTSDKFCGITVKSGRISVFFEKLK